MSVASSRVAEIVLLRALVLNESMPLATEEHLQQRGCLGRASQGGWVKTVGVRRVCERVVLSAYSDYKLYQLLLPLPLKAHAMSWWKRRETDRSIRWRVASP